MSTLLNQLPRSICTLTGCSTRRQKVRSPPLSSGRSHRLPGQSLCREIFLLLAAAIMLLSGCQGRDTSPGLELQSQDYKEARSHFTTRLIRQGPSPQQWEEMHAPPGALQVQYSITPALKAWISPPPNGNQAANRQPALLFLHGGFAVGQDDWDMTLPYRSAGFQVMVPALRGENGQPGSYSMFYNEVDDVLAAANYLASLPYVDPGHIYLAGHSVGGTLVLLTAMTTNRFHAAASFSGSPDQISWSRDQPPVVPFDPGNLREFQMRSPIAFATSFKSPVRMYYGAQESLFESPTQRTASLAKQKSLDVEAVPVPGDHFSAVPSAMRQSIDFFRSR